MPSTSIADYQVLRDTNFTLDANGSNSRTFTFDVPDDLHGLTGGARKAVISFNLAPSESSRIQILFRTEEIMDTTFSQSLTRMHQEVFDIGNIVFQDFGSGTFTPDSVEVEFRLLSGRCTFSDIVIWYQIERNV